MRLRVPSLPHSIGPALRRAMASGFGIVLLVLQMFAPQTGQAAGGEWIEICGEYGAVEIQVNLDGIPVNDADCPDCPTCALCALTTFAAMESVTHSIRFAPVARPTVLIAPQGSARNPAQYWPDNRGPPLDKAITKHTGLRALAPTHSKGEVPCS